MPGTKGEKLGLRGSPREGAEGYRSAQPKRAASAPPGLMLGRLAVKKGVLDEGRLREALRLQQAAAAKGHVHVPPLGEILVREKMISQRTLAALVKLQGFQELRKSDTFFGRLAVLNGMVDQAAVEAALEAQKAAYQRGDAPPRLGDALVERGALDPTDRDRLRSTQRRLLESRFKLRCRCGETFPVRGEDVGQRIACPKCKQTVEAGDRLIAKLTSLSARHRAQDFAPAPAPAAASPPAPARDPAKILAREKKEDLYFGGLALEMGLVKEERVDTALFEQARRLAAGAQVRLAQVLVEMGALTAADANRVAVAQATRLMVCPACVLQVELEGAKSGDPWTCKSCGQGSTIPERIFQVDEAEQEASKAFARASILSRPAGDDDPTLTPAALAGLAQGPLLANMEIQSGEDWGEYEILEKVAHGGMGVVYKARQKNLNRVVALKVLLLAGGAEDEMVERFYQEAQLAAKLKHPYIVPIHHVGQHAGRHFLTMDFIEGDTLDRHIVQGEVTPRWAMEITQKVAEAIHYAHSEHKIIHRDLKPSNVMVNALGLPQVMDFGLAKSLDSGATKHTHTGATMGTPSYMPPEQAAGEIDKVDARADVYSMGALLYEMLVGVPPFVGDSTLEIINKVLLKDPVPPRALQPAIHEDIETICLKSLEKEREKRYQSAKEMAEDIGRYLDGEAILARPIGRAERMWRKVKKHRAVSTISAVSLVAILGLAGYMFDARLQIARDRDRELVQVQRFIEAAQFAQARDLAAKHLPFDHATQLKAEAERGIQRELEAQRQARLRALLDEAWVHLKEERLDQAQAAFLAVAREEQDQAEAAQGISAYQKALAERQAAEARARLSRQVETALTDADAVLLKAQEAEDAKDKSGVIRYKVEALNAVDRALALDSTHAGAKERKYTLCTQLARYGIDNGEYGVADLVLAMAQGLRGDEEAQAELGRLRQELEAGRENAGRAQRLLNEGKDALARGEWAKARAALDDALAVFRKLDKREEVDEIARLHNEVNLGEALEQARSAEAGGGPADWTAALGLYQVAKQYAPGNASVQEGLVRMKRKLTEHARRVDPTAPEGQSLAEAIGLMEGLVRLLPQDREAAALLADLQAIQEAPVGFVYVLPARGVPGFYIGLREVTASAFAEFVRAGGYAQIDLWDEVARPHLGRLVDRTGRSGPRGWVDGGPALGEGPLPVAGVSWFEARAYARWAGARLPSEQEWFRAAAWDGERERVYPWGDDWDAQAANLASGVLAPSGAFAGDRAASGAQDLAGNVHEWTLGALLASAPVALPQPFPPTLWDLLLDAWLGHRRLDSGGLIAGRPAGPLEAVLRGGAHTGVDSAVEAKTAWRQPVAPWLRSSTVGFRLARNVVVSGAD